jgi:hypothetical protein
MSPVAINRSKIANVHNFLGLKALNEPLNSLFYLQQQSICNFRDPSANPP